MNAPLETLIQPTTSHFLYNHDLGTPFSSIYSKSSEEFQVQFPQKFQWFYRSGPLEMEIGLGQI